MSGSYRPSIAERIAWTTELGATDAKVLQALASCGDWETGRRCYPNLATLVRRSGVSRATVTRRLRRLEDPTQPGGPWIRATARRHRHSTTYDVQTDRLATRAPKEQQVTMPIVIEPHRSEAHFEPQQESEAQIEPQPTQFEAQNEPPISLPDLVPDVRTHTPRAREADDTTPDDAELPLLGPVPPLKCAHPHAHAWCEGRVHVPRILHFEFLDRLDTRPGESPSQKAGRLVAFYAANQAHLSPEAAIANPFAYWNAAFAAWVAHEAVPKVQAPAQRRPDGIPSRRGCGHDTECATRQAHIDRTIADGRAERERKSG